VRVCIVSSFPPAIAGVADYGAHIARKLAGDPRVESLTVLADNVNGAPPCERLEHLDVYRVWKRDDAGIGFGLVRAIARTRPDVVWFNLGLTMFGTRPTAAASGMMAPLLTSLLGYRTVVTLHELPALANLAALGLHTAAGKIGAALVPRLVLRADTVVVTLERYRHFLTTSYGAENVQRIPHGAFSEPECSDEPEHETALVFGTFGPHKDPGLVAAAVARVSPRRPGLRLVVAGSDHPRYRGFMADCAAHHRLGRSWIGYVPAARLPGLFATATLVVVPSGASTGSSGVIHRAMSYGRAVLASDLPDFRGLAQDDGLEVAWFKPGDPAALAGAIAALLDDSEARRRIVRHNLEAMHRLAPARIADAYLTAFEHRAPRPAARNDEATGGRMPVLQAGEKA
jgi:glycosyltransferase involved in cell wall biosynthesis